MWELAQLHLHWSNHNENGSEHTIDGKEYPAEVSKCFDDFFRKSFSWLLLFFTKPDICADSDLFQFLQPTERFYTLFL